MSETGRPAAGQPAGTKPAPDRVTEDVPPQGQAAGPGLEAGQAEESGQSAQTEAEANQDAGNDPAYGQPAEPWLEAAQAGGGELGPDLPSADAVQQSLSGESLDPALLQQRLQPDVDQARAWENLRGLARHYRHKSVWSYFLMAMMLGMIGFQSVLLGMVGAGEWDFAAYEWLLPALLVQNLAQIAGLCVIVVQALFKDKE
jgi:hypothetical protein